MVATYCTTAQVAEILQIANFDGSSIPTSTTVTNYIERAEAKIESQTGHAWKSITVTNEYLMPSSFYKYGTGIKFKLEHRSIKTLSSGSGDKLEVWNGNEWEDYLVTKTEGRNNDYWVNETEGVVYIIGTHTIYPDGVRITYRYGESSVSASIEECAVLMTAIMVLNTPEFSQASFTDDGASTRRLDNDRIQQWEKIINNILSNNTEFISM